MATIEQRPTHRVGAVWLGWVFMSTIGWIGALALLLNTGFTLSERLSPSLGTPAGMALGFAAAGLLAGSWLSVQWLVLREHYRLTARWIPISVVGFSAGIGAGVALVTALADSGVPQLLGTCLGGALAGSVLGLLQFRVLRAAFRHVMWWVPASALGTLLGFLAGTALGGAGRELLVAAAAGLVYGAVTGIVLVLLANRETVPDHGAPRSGHT